MAPPQDEERAWQRAQLTAYGAIVSPTAWAEARTNLATATAAVATLRQQMAAAEAQHAAAVDALQQTVAAKTRELQALQARAT